MTLSRSTDLRQSDEYADYMKQRGWEIESIKEVSAFIRKIPIVGSVIKIQRPRIIPPEEKLDRLAKKHRALLIKIEPPLKTGFKIKDLRFMNLESDSWPLLPSKTVLLDLSKSEESLWENLDQDAKYSIRKAQKSLPVIRYSLSGLEGEKLKALQSFFLLLRRTGKAKGFYTPKWEDLKAKAECFGEKAWLLLAKREDTNSTKEVVAGCLLLVHDKKAYYHHAASSEEGRKLLAAYLVLWEAINLAKSFGCHIFDFEGIYDERFPKATRNWKGFTYFKKKFRGREVEFPRPLIKYYSLPIKLLFRLFG